MPVKQWIAGRIKSGVVAGLRKAARAARNEPADAPNQTELQKGYKAYLRVYLWARQQMYAAHYYLFLRYWQVAIVPGKKSREFVRFSTEVFINPLQEADRWR